MTRSRQLVTEYSDVRSTYGLNNEAAIEDLMAMKADILFLLQNSTQSVYGGLYLSNPPVAFQDIGANWEKVDVFDSVSVSKPKNVKVKLETNQIQSEVYSIMQVSVTGSINHNQVNAGRVINLRLFNSTKGIQFGNVLPIGVGRNSESTAIAAVFLAESNVQTIGDDYELQLQGSNGDVIENVEFNSAIWDVSSVGEFF